MPCYHPLKAIRSSSGVTVLNGDAKLFNLQLPCGQCIGCRLERSRQWAVRCMHEASQHEHNCFITLTYDDEHLPHDGSLNHRHFQLFMKRLRKHFSNIDIRYYMCGEYGGKLGRPHFHAILFGCNFADYRIWFKSDAGSSLYRSQTLESLWTYGFSSIGAVTFESAAYVARYVMKKVTGHNVDSHYSSVSTVTGEVFQRVPEYNRMSLKPGIGAKWFARYRTDVFPHDRVIVDGTPTKPPRYYDKLLGRYDSVLLDQIKLKRFVDNLDSYMDNTPARLNSKELVADAKLSKLKRSLL